MTQNRRSTSTAASSKLRVAAVQMKFVPTIEGNLNKIRRAIEDAVRQRADAVLFPECATTGYSCDFQALNRKDLTQALNAVASLAARFRINVLIGSPVARRARLQNCLLVFDRRGRQIHSYAKCHLTADDRRSFVPGNNIALFKIDGISCTAIICHERRYPELVRLAVMAGAQILFHPNAGLDTLAVSRRKRNGRDGIVARAFENAIYYVFANSVGLQGGGKWSAGDSKIVAPDSSVLKMADNSSESVIAADLDLSRATRRYAIEGMGAPRFLAAHWRRMVQLVRSSARSNVSSRSRRNS